MNAPAEAKIGSADVLYRRARAQRLGGDARSALATLAALEREWPGFTRLHEERGQCYCALGRTREAIDAFLRAVRLNPALPESWSRLAALYRESGESAHAAQAAAYVATLQRLPPQVVTATALFCDGQLAAAEALVHAFLDSGGEDVEALRLLARIRIAQDAFAEARGLLEAVLERAPDYHAARLNYGHVLVTLQLFGPAREQARQLLAADPGNRDYRMLHAVSHAGLGEHERAVELFRAMLPGDPHPADLQLSIGHSLKTLGRREEAIEAYRAAAAARPGYGDPWWSLANLRGYPFTDADIAHMRAAEAAPGTAAADRWQLCFALGAALGERAHYAQSFQYTARGNALRHAAGRYRPETIEEEVRQQQQVCTAQFLRRNAGDLAAADPIFIVGLPRSGSTLIEQILASHSAVEATHELADIPRLVAGLRGGGGAAGHPGYPGALARLGPQDFRRMGEQYLADTRAWRSGKARFIDKMPHNFRHVGLIHLMLPGARIIDARREPMACCFANFQQLYAYGNEFSYSLADLARYYRAYLGLMRHWDAVLPGRVLRVHYEDVVEDLEGSVRRILAHCGLAFEPGCVAFHETARSIRTPSSEQVRRPLYREALERWRHYEPWLGELREALGEALTRFRE